MDNEETRIMQPQNETKKTAETGNTPSSKEEKRSSNSTARVAATAAAAVMGGMVGGAASVAAANMMNNNESEEEEVQAEVEQTPQAEPIVEPEPESVVEDKEEVPVPYDENGEPDYSNQQGADPVVQQSEPQPVPTSNGGDEVEVEVLGVYERTDENGITQEMAILTDGDEIAAVLDVDGDGIADVIGIDHNHDDQFDEGEIYDVSDQHIGMQQYEEAYIEQQQEEVEQQDTFAYEASDEPDYNNDADYSMV